MTDERGLSAKLRQRLLATSTGAELRSQAEEVARQSQERWEQLKTVHGAMRAVRETAVSPRREVAVTATWGGVIAEVSFPTAAYKRLPSAEFAALMQATVGEAQRKVNAAVAALLAPTMPAGVDAAALLAGDTDLDQLVPPSSADWFSSRGAGSAADGESERS